MHTLSAFVAIIDRAAPKQNTLTPQVTFPRALEEPGCRSPSRDLGASCYLVRGYLKRQHGIPALRIPQSGEGGRKSYQERINLSLCWILAVVDTLLG